MAISFNMTPRLWACFMRHCELYIKEVTAIKAIFLTLDQLDKLIFVMNAEIAAPAPWPALFIQLLWLISLMLGQ